MLPPEADQYFKNLCSRSFAGLAREFLQELSGFQRGEAARSQVGGRGYVARMAALYEKHLKREAAALVQVQRDVHAGFESPVDDGVIRQLQNWGLTALDSRFEAMRGALARELGRYGVSLPDDISFEHTKALAATTVANQISDDIWTLRNVSMKRIKPAENGVPNVTYNGPVGAVFHGGEGNSATVQQKWAQDSIADLLEALAEFRGAVGDPKSGKVGALPMLDDVVAALKSGSADRNQVREWLASIASTVQTAASLSPAWELVKKAAAVAGFPF